MSDVASPVYLHGEMALDVREITVSYGGIRAVDDVSFSAQPGTIVGLIGPNGAGKTTLFDAISGFAPPERGRIVLGGRDVTGLSAAGRARAGLGRSFQDGRLFPSLTVAETLAVALERHAENIGPMAAALRIPGVRAEERKTAERVEGLIEVMGLSAFRDKFIGELSTGSRRIVDLACVLAHEPTVLLLDEPSSGIAQKETEALGPLLLRVKEQTGCTMLLIEHDMPLVTSVSDELIALETGRVIARGSPEEVTSHPQVVEAYLGTDERIVARSGALRAAPAPKPEAPAKTAKPTKKRTLTTARKTKTTTTAKTTKTTTTAKTTKTTTTAKTTASARKRATKATAAKKRTAKRKASPAKKTAGSRATGRRPSGSR